MKTSKSGISVVTLLTLIFVTLKLTHNIDWNWWWVLSPLWISTAISTVVLFVWLIRNAAKK